MGIADVRRAFDKGLAGKAACVGATMRYAKGDNPGQLLRFDVHLKNGSAQVVEGVVPHNTDINEQARQMGATFAETL
jgi:hypothetical protein